MYLNEIKKQCDGTNVSKDFQTLQQCKQICLDDNNCKYIDYALNGSENDDCKKTNGIKTCRCYTINHSCNDKVDNSKYAIWKKLPSVHTNTDSYEEKTSGSCGNNKIQNAYYCEEAGKILEAENKDWEYHGTLAYPNGSEYQTGCLLYKGSNPPKVYWNEGTGASSDSRGCETVGACLCKKNVEYFSDTMDKI